MKMKKTLIFAFGILFVILGIVSVSAVTGSMGNAKMVLYPEVNGWTNTVIPKTILINNVNTIPINVTLRTDENASKFVNLIDESFVLEPGENKKAQIEIRVKKVGTYEGKINVFFKPIDSQEAGVVLSSQIVVIASKNNGYEETEEENNTQTNTGNSSSTNGNTNNGTSGPSKLVKIWGFSTLILLVVLLILLYLWSKKRNKSKRKRKYK